MDALKASEYFCECGAVNDYNETTTMRCRFCGRPLMKEHQPHLQDQIERKRLALVPQPKETLTKREEFAKAAMQSIFSGAQLYLILSAESHTQIVLKSFEIADAMIAESEKRIDETK